jgi:hypothetical protein
MTEMRGLIRRFVTLMLLGSVFAACTSATGAPKSQPPAETAGSTSEVTAEADCYAIDENVDTPPLTVATLSRVTTAVVIAEVKAIEGGVWNTENGAKPDKARGPRFNPGIVTPINLQVLESVQGELGPGAVRVVNPGGTAGCVEHSVDNAAVLEKGRTYAFFLQPSPDADGDRHADLPQVLVAWPVAADGSVETPYDGTLSRDDFNGLVENPVEPPEMAEPTPAGLDNPG